MSLLDQGHRAAVLVGGTRNRGIACPSPHFSPVSTFVQKEPELAIKLKHSCRTACIELLRLGQLGTIPFVMILVGCAPNSVSCEPIATMPVTYASEENCLRSRAEIIAAFEPNPRSSIQARCQPQRSAPQARSPEMGIPSA